MTGLGNLKPATTKFGGLIAAPLATAFLLAACSGGGADKAEGRRGQNGPAEVGYMIVQPTSVPLTTALSGRVTA